MRIENLMNAKAELLRDCHEIIRNMNDEEAYMNWIWIVPDEATEEDFIDLANNTEDFNYCLRLFARLIEEYD